MKTKRCGWGVFLVFISACCVAGSAGAACIFETSDFITGAEGNIYEIEGLGKCAEGYNATLSDLSFGGMEFETLMLSISTSEEMLDFIPFAGSFHFYVDPDTRYFANVFGVAGGDFNTGLYGLKIAHAPIPSSLLLFISGIFCVIGIRKKSRDKQISEGLDQGYT